MTSQSLRRVSGWKVAFLFAFTLLGLRLAVALARHESFRDDLALPTLLFFVLCAVGGSALFGRRP